MAIAKYDNKRNPGLCGQNTEYITRTSKADEIHFHGIYDLENEIEKDDLEARREAAMAYGETRELESKQNQRIKNGEKRQDRNHQTLILSWDRTEDSKKAAEMTQEFLDEKFEDARAIYSIHTDKQGQTHAHVWIDNVKEDGKALQLKPKDFYTLDEKWAQKYDKEYGTEYAPVFKELKEETKEWKQQKAEAKREGREFTEKKPERTNDLVKANLKENMRRRELENTGVKSYDKARGDGDKRILTVGREAVEASERDIERSEQTIEQRIESSDRAEHAAGGAVREATEVSKTIENLPERELPDRDISRDSFDR